MLILTRRRHEKIMIGDTTCIKVLDFNFTRVTLGIDAPREIAVYRQEIYQKIQQQQALYQKIGQQAVEHDVFYP